MRRARKKPEAEQAFVRAGDPLLEHGGTDSEAEPRYDFSSNANALGPCPFVLRAAKRADLSRYPDPHYQLLRTRLASVHGAAPEQIAVGAGASELIVRLIRHLPGSVLLLGPTFSEYERGARIAGRTVLVARSPEEFLRLQRTQPTVGFVCWPNNPTGDAWDTGFVQAAANASPLVIDLAYSALCGADAHSVEAAAAKAFRLYSPNKTYGLTGIRGAYVVAPESAEPLAALAPSWVIGREAVAMLEASIRAEAHGWLTQSLPTLHRWRVSLAEDLRERGIAVRESPASFLLAEVGDATTLTRGLRARGIRVRDATSFGLDRYVRLSAQSPHARRALVAALKSLR